MRKLPRVLDSVDFAVINSNYAIAGGLNPIVEALAFEGSSSAYSNILACKSGNENTPKIQALKVALEIISYFEKSQEVIKNQNIEKE